jgi:hypothetical protein
VADPIGRYVCCYPSASSSRFSFVKFTFEFCRVINLQPSTFNYFLLAKLFIFLSVRLSCALNKVFLAALHAFRDGPSGRRPPDPPLRRGRRRCCPWI